MVPIISRLTTVKGIHEEVINGLIEALQLVSCTYDSQRLKVEGIIRMWKTGKVKGHVG